MKKHIYILAFISLIMNFNFITSFSQVLTHDYQLNGTFNDSFAGPSIIPAGGTIGPNVYTFGFAQGPSLSNAVNPSHYSIEIVLNLEEIIGWKKIIDFKNQFSDNGLYCYDGGLEFYPIITGLSGAINTNQTVHMVLTRDGPTNLVVGYINCIPQIEFYDVDGHAIFSETDNIIQFLIDDNETSLVESPSGFIDRIRIFDGPLTQSQICDLINGFDVTNGLVAYYPFNGNANDESGYGNDGTEVGTMLCADRLGSPNSAYSFDGIDDFIYVDNNSVLNDIETQDVISVTAWVYVDNWYQNWNIFNFINKYNTSTDFGWEYQFGNSFPGANMHFNSNWSASSSNASLDFNRWFHVGMTYSRSDQEIRFYMNGQLLGANVYNADLEITDGPLYIGYSPAGPNEYSDGIIDELRIYNRVLSEGEIQCIYSLQSNNKLSVDVSPSPTIPEGDLNTIYLGYGNQNVTLTASDGSSFEWSSIPAGTYTNTQSIIVSPIVTTTYTVEVENEYGCYGNGVVTIHVVDWRCGNNNNKVKVCHNGRMICVDNNAVQAHLDHGDYLGECQAKISIHDREFDHYGDNNIGLRLGNSPNPFSSKCDIEFNIPEEGNTVLTVYDLLSREVATVVNSHLKAGEHSFEFDGSKLIPGMYIYKLTSNNQSIIQKMIISR